MTAMHFACRDAPAVAYDILEKDPSVVVDTDNVCPYFAFSLQIPGR